jgi:hypothetical protein
VPTSRQKRKQRARAGASRAGSPRAVRSPRRDQQAAVVRERRSGERMLGTVGERPESPFGGLPVSELMILAGGVSAVIGFISDARPALFVGLAVVAVGVLEFTAREHFSGYRSHTTLLAGIPTVIVEAILISTIGSHTTREVLLLLIIPVFGGLFFVLRRTFLAARQRRVARR